MRGLWLLRLSSKHLNDHFRTKWLPSAINKFADALLRQFSREDLSIKQQLRRSIAAGMKALVEASKYRQLGEHPSVLWKFLLEEPGQLLDDRVVRVLFPPMDPIMETVNMLVRPKVAAVLLILDCHRQAWHQAAIQLCQRWHRLLDLLDQV